METERTPPEDRNMRHFYCYVRLLIACTLLMGGFALQFLPTASQIGRDARWQMRQLETVPAADKAQWIADHDNQSSESEASVRLFGVFLGGIGMAGALLESAYLCARFVRE
jgi:hypothetical protein